MQQYDSQTKEWYKKSKSPFNYLSNVCNQVITGGL